MERTDSAPKQTAVDSKSAYAGSATPDPEMGVDRMGTQAGLDVRPEEPLAIAEKLSARDRNRDELEPTAIEAQARSRPAPLEE